MRILMVNHSFDAPAGSETYALTVAEQLLKLGHTVTAFSPRLGEVAQRLRGLGIGTVDDAREADEVDVIHASHQDATHLAMAAHPLVPVVSVVHGAATREVLERPPGPRVGIERWVTVSERVAKVLAWRDGLDPAEIAVIPNPVDLERFAPRIPVKVPAVNVLLLSHHHDPSFQRLVSEAAAQASMQVRFAGGLRRRSDMPSELNHADIVVTLGRGAIEASACGRPVIVLDRYGGDGLLTPESAPMGLATNYSGLSIAEVPTVSELAGLLRNATRELGMWGRSWVEEHHDARALVPRLVTLYEEAVASWQARLGREGEAELLRQRYSDFYPAVRWWHDVPPSFDWQRAAHQLPVWAPDSDEELGTLLERMRDAYEAQLESEREAHQAELASRLQTYEAQLEAERAAADARMKASEDELTWSRLQTEQQRAIVETIHSTRAWRLRTWILGAPLLGGLVRRVSAILRRQRGRGM